MLEGIFVPLRLDKLIECQIIRASTVTGQIFTASLPRRLFASRLLKHKMYRIWQDDYCIDALIQFNFLTRDNKIIDGTVSPPRSLATGLSLTLQRCSCHQMCYFGCQTRESTQKMWKTEHTVEGNSVGGRKKEGATERWV